MPLTSRYLKKVSSKKKSDPPSLYTAKSADQLDAVEIANSKERILLLEKELEECKAELQALKESSAAQNNEEIESVKNENADLKKLINELQGENSDMKKVFGSLDDLGDLRNQYERLFEDDFKSPKNEIDVDSLTSNPAEAEERRKKTRVFCEELKSFISGVRTNSLVGL